MVKKYVLLFGFLMIMAQSGCGPVREFSKTLWGSSTRALERSRAHALTADFRCDIEACYQAVLSLTGPAPKVTGKETPEIRFNLFLKKDRQHMMVLMGVPGSVDTTEVGVFLTPGEAGEVRVEISSLSTYAKTRVAETVFPLLASRFEKVAREAPAQTSD